MKLTTERLVMRPFEEEDRAPFAALNADPEVMRYFEAPLSRDESDRLIDVLEERRAEDGFSFLALTTHDGAFVGMAGIARPRFDVHFTPCVETGWRLARANWRKGYATEAAKAAMTYGFSEMNLPEIVAFTPNGNARSRAVMQRLGMTHDPADDFDHPNVSAESGLNPLVLYRLPNSEKRS